MRKRSLLLALLATAAVAAVFALLAARALRNVRLEVVAGVRARLESEADAAAATAGRRLDAWLATHLVGPAAWRFGKDGRFVRPPKPVPFAPLAASPETPQSLLDLLRDGQAAELTKGGLPAAAGFYRRAVSLKGPAGFHRVALSRLAAVTARLGDEKQAEKLWTSAAAAGGDTELALAAAVEGARVKTKDLVESIVRHLGAEPEDVARGYASRLGLLDRPEVRARLRELSRMKEIEPRLLPLPPKDEIRRIPIANGEAGFERGDLVTVASAEELGRILGPAARREGVDPAGAIVEEAGGAGPLEGVRFSVRAGPEDVRTAVDRQAALLLLAVGLAAAAAVAALAFLFKSVRREAELAALRTDFVANVSHDLRTPLARIRLYAETLSAGLVPEGEAAEYLAIVDREAADLTRLVDGVLDFARIEKGTKEYRREPGDLAAFVRRVGEEARSRPGGESLTLEVPDREIRAEFDAEALTRAIGNLLDNAKKHAGGAGVILALRPAEDGSARIEVADRGPGVPAADVEKIFDRFHRGRGAAGGGSGLGLTLVRHTARGHGGEAGHEPREGGGSVFFLEIPLERGEEMG